VNNKRVVYVLLGGLIAVLGAVIILLEVMSDNEAPKITIDTNRLTSYSKAQGKDFLLSCATAKDARDGDVSKNVVIASIHLAPDYSYALVEYTATDSAKNVSTLTVKVPYVKADDEGVYIDASEHSVENASGTQVTTTAAGRTTGASGTQITTEPTTKAGGPLITMKVSSAEIERGASFNIMRYVDELQDDKDTKDELSRRVSVSGEANTSVAGTYQLEVFCTDSDGNRSNTAEFILTVK
jgi:hypothetical protein